MSTDFRSWRRRWRRRSSPWASRRGGAGAVQHPPYVPPYVKSNLVQVDVYDRNDGTALPVFQKDGRHYIVGVPGHEYAVRIRNCTGARILVVTSVDGVNVISGDTAAPSQSGYVLDPWASVEIAGWRKSLERTAAFYFTDLGDSYAARTGRPQNVGVIGVAVFEERPKRIAHRDHGYREGGCRAAEPPPEQAARGTSARRCAAASPAPRRHRRKRKQRAGGARHRLLEEFERQESKDEMQSLAKLGTGHGRNEESRVTRDQLRPRDDVPAETVAIQYDRRENLIAMGVMPQPTPYIARREPNPFPGAMRFAPDPGR